MTIFSNGTLLGEERLIKPAPDMVILQLETKSVTALSAVDIGSSIEDFVFLVYDMNGFTERVGGPGGKIFS